MRTEKKVGIEDDWAGGTEKVGQEGTKARKKVDR